MWQNGVAIRRLRRGGVSKEEREGGAGDGRNRATDLQNIAFYDVDAGQDEVGAWAGWMVDRCIEMYADCHLVG